MIALPSVAVLVVALLLAFGLPLHAHAQAADEVAVDASVLPGDDFFRYANGPWLKSTTLPAGKPAWGARSEIAARTQQQVMQLLGDAKQAPRGSDARKVADFRAAYLDEPAIESGGLASLKPLFARIDAVHDKASLTRLLGREIRADVDPMFFGVYDSSHVVGVALQAGRNGEKQYLAFLLQGGLGMPARESYLADDAAAQAKRSEYQARVAETLAALGATGAAPASHVGERAAAVMRLETELARSHATRELSDNERNADTVWTRADFAREAPGIDWNAFLAAAGLGKQEAFVAWQPGALKGLAAEVASRPLDAWKDYLRVHAVARLADVLPRKFSPPREGDRAQRALEATQSAMADLIAKMYAQRYFPPEQKARLQAIAANVVAAFSKRVEAAQWMSPPAKAMALAKLKGVYIGVGYPDRWLDHSPLVIDARDAAGNAQRVAREKLRTELAKVGQPVEQSEWGVVPQWPGAMLQFNMDMNNFAAAFLQPPKFDPAASDATNYGAIGAILGHELSHHVDTLGADYEADGRHRKWWSDGDMQRYEAVTQPLVRQFSAYRPLPDVAVDGKLALSENLADLGGLAAAFDAYRATLGNKADDKAFVRRSDREFFLGFARAWRVVSTDDALRKQAASDHSPEAYRVATVRNIDAWYDAFDVKPGQRLYLEPAARVRGW